MPTQKEINLEIASTGIEEVTKQFPLGGLNRVDVFDGLEASIAMIQFQLFSTLRCSYGLPEEEKITSMLIKSGMLKGAFCDELAEYTKGILEEMHPDAAIEMVFLKDHAMLVIGRDPDSDPKDITTWGDDAIICDPWAGQVYEASDFALMKKEGEKIPFYTNFFIDHSKKKVIVDKRDIEKDYLSGTPVIAGHG